jgi:hypothetical protein
MIYSEGLPTRVHIGENRRFMGAPGVDGIRVYELKEAPDSGIYCGDVHAVKPEAECREAPAPVEKTVVCPDNFSAGVKA